MKPYQQRAIQERDELEARADKLREFLMWGSLREDVPQISDAEQQRMWAQLHAMDLYLFILNQRIENFDVEEPA